MPSDLVFFVCSRIVLEVKDDHGSCLEMTVIDRGAVSSHEQRHTISSRRRTVLKHMLYVDLVYHVRTTQK
jgi:hypothetical protein